MTSDPKACVLVINLLPSEHARSPSETKAACLEICVRLPRQVGGSDIRLMREQSEVLDAQLLRLATRLGPKPPKVKSKKADAASKCKTADSERAGVASSITVRLFDEAEEELPRDIPSGQAWPSAKIFVVSGFPEQGDLSMPVYWNPPQVLAVQLSGQMPIVGVPLSASLSVRGCLPEHCRLRWERSSSSKPSPPPDEWEEVGKDMLYWPESADQGKRLRVCCHPPVPGEVGYSAATKEVVQPQLDHDVWRFEAMAAVRDVPAFRVATYNVLADAYAGKAWHLENLWSHCAPGVIHAPHRRQRILRDLLQLDADVFGLQEVDGGQLSALAPLSALGWEHAYTRKAGAAADGCALFWRRSRFEEESPVVEMRLGGEIVDRPGLTGPTLAAVLKHANTRDVLAHVSTVAQCVLLRDKLTGCRLLVANTHLYYHPNANHIRLLQLHMLLSELKERKTAAQAQEGDTMALLLLGDLNARKGNFGPTDKHRPPQAAYRLVRDGAIFADDVDWEQSLWVPEEWSSRPCKPDLPEACICCQNRGFVDGYGVCPLCGGEGVDFVAGPSLASDELLQLTLELPLPLVDPNEHIEVTNFTLHFQECIDYILLDAQALQVVSSMAPPPLERLQAETALPSTMFPSDHIPVWADIAFGPAR